MNPQQAWCDAGPIFGDIPHPHRRTRQWLDDIASNIIEVDRKDCLTNVIARKGSITLACKPVENDHNYYSQKALIEWTDSIIDELSEKTGHDPDNILINVKVDGDSLTMEYLIKSNS